MSKIILNRILLVCMVALSTRSFGSAATLEEAHADFRKPLPEYSSGPLWVWNDLMTDEQVTSTLRELREQRMTMAFIHPRPGLMTPYMSEEWLRLWQLAVEEAERLGMQVWIYDENSYPSGFAGGLVPDAMPDAVQKGFAVSSSPLPDRVKPDTLAVFALEGDKSTDITTRAKAGEKFTTGTYLTLNIESNAPAPWFGGKTYVDLLRRDVVDKFLELTLEPYRKRFGDKFGKIIPGVFTDEPNIRIHSLAHTPRIFELFQARWGYDLRPHLASLFATVGDYKRVRHNYMQLLNEQFTDSWAKTYYEYCEKHGLELTGHYWDHEWPNVLGVPDDMAMYAWEQRPSIDCLMNNYDEGTHGQFGNARAVREMSSVANQLGRKRTLCEVYGAGGWDLRFEDQKRIADWLAVLGVNTFNQHLTYQTIRGARKRDHPQSFSYHAPYWQDYHVMGDYLARLSAVASAGEQVNDVLLFQPTTTAFIYQTGPDSPPRLKELGDAFTDIHLALERAQVDYDIGSEYVMEKWGKVADARLEIGKRSYRTIIIPARTENLNTATLSLMKDFAAAGGQILCCGEQPHLLNGSEMDAGTSASIASWQKVPVSEAVSQVQRIDSGQRNGVSINWNPVNNGKLFHRATKLADGYLLMLVNTSIDQPARGEWNAPGQAECWDLASGNITSLSRNASTSRFPEFNIAPCGSMVIAVGTKLQTTAPAARDSATSTTVPAAGPMQIKRTHPNVLTLDFMDLQVADDVTTGLYFFKAAQKAFRKHGLKDNPWANAVQFKDEILKKTFPKQFPVSATYRFTLREKVPQDLAIAIERPDLYTITCNGTNVEPSNEWWLDRAFKKVPIATAVRVGENDVRIAVREFGIYTELEPAYLLGSFSLETASNGFVVHPEKPLQLGSWAKHGAPMYGHAVSYANQIAVPQVDAGTSYCVKLGKWHGSVARVRVNGKHVGIIGWAPWECDVTNALKPGDNVVEVEVVGTLKNTLGPFHSTKPRGSAWPSMFQAAPETGPPPGSSYDVIDYGLFEPFQIIARQ